jgi:hypothetical protein
MFLLSINGQIKITLVELPEGLFSLFLHVISLVTPQLDSNERTL